VIEVFYIGQNDVLPYYPIGVRNQDGVVDLSDLGVTAVYFGMVNISTGSVVVSAVAVITDINNGLVEYRWAAGDTAVPADYAVSMMFVTPAGTFTLPRSTMAKVVVENKYVTG
jgi:hypothetical protein